GGTRHGRRQDGQRAGHGAGDRQEAVRAQEGRPEGRLAQEAEGDRLTGTNKQHERAARWPPSPYAAQVTFDRCSPERSAGTSPSVQAKNAQFCLVFAWGISKGERELIGVLSVRPQQSRAPVCAHGLRDAGLGHLSSLENELRGGSK